MPELHCYADICLVPIGTANPSVSDYIAEVEKIIRASGLKNTLHSAGTTIEGPYYEVMTLIGKLHERVHELGCSRVHSDIRVGTRTDKSQTAADKIRVVEEKLLNK